LIIGDKIYCQNIIADLNKLQQKLNDLT